MTPPQLVSALQFRIEVATFLNVGWAKVSPWIRRCAGGPGCPWLCSSGCYSLQHNLIELLNALRAGNETFIAWIYPLTPVKCYDTWVCVSINWEPECQHTSLFHTYRVGTSLKQWMDALTCGFLQTLPWFGGWITRPGYPPYTSMLGLIGSYLPPCAGKIHLPSGTLKSCLSKHQMWYPWLHVSHSTILLPRDLKPHTLQCRVGPL